MHSGPHWEEPELTSWENGGKALLWFLWKEAGAAEWAGEGLWSK